MPTNQGDHARRESEDQPKADFEKKFKRFKRRYFKGKIGFTGEELQQCRDEFWKKFGKLG